MTTTIERPAPPPATPTTPPSRRGSLVRGRPGDPAWVRPALLVLLAGTALLYLWDLGASGDANSFYAAAVQAGSESWKSWFFGSIDTSNFITVDKPPGSLWVMGLSARIFGYSSWSLLVPSALEGVATVALLFAAVRRVAGPRAALIAGTVLALTPAAALIFRFDNPDALLVMLVVAASYAMTRALEKAGTRWLVLVGVCLGLAFLTKTAQALLVVPPLGLVYLVAAPTGVWRRIRQLLVGLVAMVVAAGWWFAAVSLWPASDRPYIGGSTDNNPLELAFGYNGLSRLFGGSGNGGGGGAGGGGGNSSFGGATGLARMFDGEFGLEISWLLPAALVGLVAIAWLTWRRPRTDALRAGLIIWGGTLLVTGLTFSFMQGTIHPYYSVALAPAIGAVVGIGADRLWERRGVLADAVLVAMVAVSAIWGLVLLHRQSAAASIQVLVAVLAVLAVLGLGWRALARSRQARSRQARSGQVRSGQGRPTGRRLAAAFALTAILAGGIPVATWGVETAGSTHTGSIPTAVSSSGTSGFGGGSFGGGAMGGDSTTDSALTTALQATTTTWAAATVGSTSAAGLELASDTAVMAIGGFSGSDDAPTLAQFKAYVAAGDVTYFVVSAGGGGGGFGGGALTGGAPTGGAPTGGAPTGGAPTGGTGTPGGGSTGSSSAITAWVEATYPATTIGGSTVYLLTATS